MGYSHYFDSRVPFKQEAWDAFVTNVIDVFKVSTVKIGDCMGEGGKPLINAAEIGFNGIDDEGCETFYINKKANNESVKTLERAYDTVVCAVLLLACYHNPDITVTSDGFKHEWHDGLALARQATGLPVVIPATIKERP